MLNKIASTKINLPSLSSISPNSSASKNFTQIKDLDLKILSELNDRDLLNICLTNKYFSRLCQNEDFWRNRFLTKFGNRTLKYKGFSKNGNPLNYWENILILSEKTWKKFYLTVISDLKKYKTDPWEFFNIVSWHLNDYDAPLFIYSDRLSKMLSKLEQAPEQIKNNYHFLNLGKEITLKFPIDPNFDSDNKSESDDENVIEETYTTETNFTPVSVLKLIHDFYYAEKAKISLRWGHLFFEGFRYEKYDDKIPDYFILKIGSSRRI